MRYLVWFDMRDRGWVAKCLKRLKIFSQTKKTNLTLSVLFLKRIVVSASMMSRTEEV